MAKREFRDPSTTTEADRALRMRKDLADARAKLREAETWRERAAQVPKLERDVAAEREKVKGLQEEMERLRGVIWRLQREVEAKTGAAEDAARLREERAARKAAAEIRRVEIVKSARRTFAENERLKRELRANG